MYYYENICATVILKIDLDLLMTLHDKKWYFSQTLAKPDWRKKVSKYINKLSFLTKIITKPIINRYTTVNESWELNSKPTPKYWLIISD